MGKLLDDIKQVAQGRWREIHNHFNIAVPDRVGRHGPCPCCGGKDRFRLLKDYENTGEFVCGGGNQNTLQVGDGIDLVQHKQGGTLYDAMRAIANYLGLERETDESHADTIARMRFAEKQRKRKTRRAFLDDQTLYFANNFTEKLRQRKARSKQIDTTDELTREERKQAINKALAEELDAVFYLLTAIGKNYQLLVTPDSDTIDRLVAEKAERIQQLAIKIVNSMESRQNQRRDSTPNHG